MQQKEGGKETLVVVQPCDSVCAGEAMKETAVLKMKFMSCMGLFGGEGRERM